MIILNTLQFMMAQNILTRALLLMFVFILVYCLFRRVLK